MKDIYLIGNTHFDPVWLWRWEEAMSSIHATFRSALDRMNEDGDFIYSFATPQVFEWLRETDPAMLDEIRARVAEGRWELPEGWWLQPDCFSASGESYARQGLYGQKYLREHFGSYTDTVFNIDSFGHNSQTPQLLARSGMRHYVLCRPEPQHLPLAAPYFQWIGKDGSRIKAFRVGQYSEIYNKDMRAAVSAAEETMKDAPCDEMMVYGVTDHGGAPTKQAIADIHALAAEKDYRLLFSTVSGYFKAQKAPTVTVRGELLTGDFGPYVNHPGIKQRNRLAEYSALNAEKAALLSEQLLSRPYPKERLHEIWKDILFHQFHDILGGACIKEAYFDAYNALGRAITNAEEITKYSLTAITHKLRMPGKNPDNPWNLTVWNLNPADFDGYLEAELQWLHEFPAYEGGILLEDEVGNRYETQKLLEGSVIKGFRSRILFRAAIPSLGYRTFKVIKTDTEARISDYRTPTSLTAGGFQVDFDRVTGLIRTLTCLRSGRVFPSPVTPTVLSDDGDTWCFGSRGYGAPIGTFALRSITVTEEGCHRTTVKTTHTLGASMLTLSYTFYPEYVDVAYRIHWNEHHTVLKLVLDFGYPELLVSSPFASEERGDTERDHPAGEWLYMHGESEGAGILLRGAFAYHKQGSCVAVSLLRSCIYGDLRIGELDPHADYPYMDQGITEGSLRILPCIDLRGTALSAEATHFNNPPIILCDTNHDGPFPPTDRFATFALGSGSVSAIKKAHDDDDMILRLFEALGNEQPVKLQCFGASLETTLKPYEIKTLRLSNGRFRETDLLED